MAKPTFVVMLQEDEYKTNVVISGDALLIPMNNLRSLKEGFRLIASKAPVTCLFIVAHGLEGRVEVGSSTQHASGLGIGANPRQGTEHRCLRVQCGDPRFTDDARQYR